MVFKLLHQDFIVCLRFSFLLFDSVCACGSLFFLSVFTVFTVLFFGQPSNLYIYSLFIFEFEYETANSLGYVIGYFPCVYRGFMWFPNSIKDSISKGYVLFKKEAKARLLLKTLELQQSAYYPHVLLSSAMSGVGSFPPRLFANEAKSPLAMSGPNSSVHTFMPTATRLHHLPPMKFRRSKGGYTEPRWTTSYSTRLQRCRILGHKWRLGLRPRGNLGVLG